MAVQTIPAAGHVLVDWRPEDESFWSSRRRGDRAPQPVDLDRRRCCSPSRSGWSGARSSCSLPRVGLRLQRRPAVLAGCAARALGRHASHLLQLHGADLRRPALDRDLDRLAPDPGARHRLRRAEPEHALLAVPAAGAALRLRRRQLRLLDGQHQLLLPQGAEGAGARPQCRPRQSRRERGPARRAARDHRGHVRRARRRAAAAPGRQPALAAERRLRLGAAHRRRGHRRLVRHERHRERQSLVRRADGDLPAQA